MQDFQVETCNDVGQVVTPDLTGLCNVLLNSPILSTSNTYVGWKDLALTSCALLDTTRTLCFRVDTSGGTQRISAATAVVGFEFVISSNRRRLLSEINDNDNNDIEARVKHMLWNASWIGSGAEPCVSLVESFRRNSKAMTSVMDRHALKHCLHWRLASNATLIKYAPGYHDDMFLLSYQGMSKAWMEHEFVQGMVVEHFPYSFLYLASFADWAGPLVQSWHEFESFANTQLVQWITQHVMAYKNVSGSNASQLEVIHRLEQSKRFVRHILPFVHAGSMFVEDNLYAGRNISRKVDMFINVLDDASSWTNTSSETKNGGRRRRLLVAFEEQTDSIWKDTLDSIPVWNDSSASNNFLQTVQVYSALIATASSSAALSTELANRWKTGPFNWPTSVLVGEDVKGQENNFYYCPAGQDAANVIVNAFLSLQQQLANISMSMSMSSSTPYDNTRRVSASLLPRIHFKDVSNTSIHVQVPLGLGIEAALDSKSQPWFETLMGYLVGFFTGGIQETDDGYTASRILKEAFVCSFDKVVLKCQGKRTSLVSGTISILIVLGLGYIALSYPVFVFLSFFSIGGLVLATVYGYSPACIPMVPPCIVEDMVGVIAWFIPLQVQWPPALQKIENCAFNGSVPLEQCFKSCSDQPFMYTSWEAPLAWALCDWDPVWCVQTVAPWASSINAPNSFIQMLQQKSNTLLSQNYLSSSTQSFFLVEAERFCFGTHLIYLVPYLFIILLLAYGIYAAILIPLALLQGLLDLGVQTLVFVHMQVATPSQN